MTYEQDFTLPSEILEQVAERGLDFLPKLIRIIFNTAMQAERERYLGAAPYQRSPDRRGQANGFKPKTVKTRVGEVRFDIPSAPRRFLSQCAREGTAERALHLTLAEMYLQGVSTRKVSAIIEQLCGSQVSST